MRDDVETVEARFDYILEMLFDQGKNLTVRLNKKTQGLERPPLFCSYFQKEEQYSNQCRENPMKTAPWEYCHEMSHTTNRCFQKQMAVSIGRLQRNEKTDERSSNQRAKIGKVTAPQVSVVDEGRPSLIIKRYHEENVVFKR